MKDQLKQIDNLITDSKGKYIGVSIQIHAEGVIAILRASKKENTIRGIYTSNPIDAVNELHKRVFVCGK